MPALADTFVTLDCGTETPLDAVFCGEPFALVFLRHFGCPFCRQLVAEFAEHPELPVLFVGMANQERTARFKAKAGSPHRFVCDPKAELYEKFQVARGGPGRIFGPKNVRDYFRARRKGYGLQIPRADMWRLGAAFVIDGTGRVVWEHRNEHASDNVQINDIRIALNRIS